VKKRIIIFILSYLTWCLINWLPDWEHLLTGIFVSAFVTFMVGDLFVKRQEKMFSLKRFFVFVFQYVPFFIFEALKGSLDMAYRIIHPAVLVNSGIVKVKTNLRADLSLTFLANSITLSAGTMAVDIDEKNGILYVHCVNLRGKELGADVKRRIEKFERIINAIFD
jgi:multicomponent Na+:H+ antiporter subunit E